MKLIRQRSKSASVFLVILMVLLTVPFQSVLAAMIETEATLDISVKGQEARNMIKTILAREDAQAVLRAQGIDPVEASARVDSLTDTEAMRIADQSHGVVQISANAERTAIDSSRQTGENRR